VLHGRLDNGNDNDKFKFCMEEATLICNRLKLVLAPPLNCSCHRINGRGSGGGGKHHWQREGVRQEQQGQ
jgi:hypothetical protein